jgi:FkbM family methyltransferase
MLIKLSFLVDKYSVLFKSILHVGAHECEEINLYEKYVTRDKILWIEALKDKVEYSKSKFPNILIENQIVSDKIETVVFNRSNNGQSSSILELELHKEFHPSIFYVESFQAKTELLSNILLKYPNQIFNFINIDIQGAELKALKGLGDYLNNVDYLYLEVNYDYLYKDCALVDEIDMFLFNFERVETQWCENFRWGDAFYIRKTLIPSSI